MESETCEICTGTPFQSDMFNQDLRRLTASYGYRLDEGSRRLHHDARGYTIRTCKDCRGEFLEMLWAWARGDLLAKRTDELNPEADVAIRRGGRTVMVTREEWEASRRDKETP